MRANWRVEAKDEAIVNGKRAVEGFHHVTMTVAAGGRQIVKEDGGVHPGLDAFTVQLTNTSALGGDDRASRQLADASLTTRNNAIDFREQVVDKVALAVSVSGSRSAAVAFEIRCVPLDRTFAEWQNTVFDILLDAWRAWNDSWRRQQQDAAGPRLAAVDAGSPALNKELVHIELKRMVVTWLLASKNSQVSTPWHRAQRMAPQCRSSVPQTRATAAITKPRTSRGRATT